MFEGIVKYFTHNTMEGKAPGQNGKINIVPGFETYLGNYRVIKRYMKVGGDSVDIKLERGQELSTLEINIELPGAGALQARGAA